MIFGGQLVGNSEHWVELIVSNPVDQLLALKTWAVVGLSNNSERAAYRVSKLLIEKGHQVIPVHPKAETVHGQKGYAKLSDIPGKVDVVDIFVNSLRKTNNRVVWKVFFNFTNDIFVWVNAKFF